MTSFDARQFMLGIDHLDGVSRELLGRHGKVPDGRMSLIEHLVDDAMLRLAAEVLRGEDGHGNVEH